MKYIKSSNPNEKAKNNRLAYILDAVDVSR